MLNGYLDKILYRCPLQEEINYTLYSPEARFFLMYSDRRYILSLCGGKWSLVFSILLARHCKQNIASKLTWQDKKTLQKGLLHFLQTEILLSMSLHMECWPVAGNMEGKGRVSEQGFFMQLWQKKWEKVKILKLNKHGKH